MTYKIGDRICLKVRGEANTKYVEYTQSDFSQVRGVVRNFTIIGKYVKTAELVILNEYDDLTKGWQITAEDCKEYSIAKKHAGEWAFTILPHSIGGFAKKMDCKWCYGLSNR